MKTASEHSLIFLGLALLSGAWAFPTPVFAGPTLITGDLVEICTGHDPAAPVPRFQQTESRKLFCQGYVAGASDAFIALGSSKTRFCLPKDVTVQQMTSRFILNTGRVMEKPALDVIRNAMAEEFPASKSDCRPYAVSSRVLWSMCKDGEEPRNGFCAGFILAIGSVFDRRKPGNNKPRICFDGRVATMENVWRRLSGYLTAAEHLGVNLDLIPGVTAVLDTLSAGSPCR